jgi:photosystem II cytochrome c550
MGRWQNLLLNPTHTLLLKELLLKDLMPHRVLRIRLLTLVVGLWSCLLLFSAPVQAAGDLYITRYLKVTDAIALEQNDRGQTRLFSPEELASGKQLFEQNCLNCHVGGSTLPDPSVSLSLRDLQGATPPRTTIEQLVAYLRQPMTYDGSEETFWCRQVPESWLSQVQVESLAGFLLRAAQVAPGWGTEAFTGE